MRSMPNWKRIFRGFVSLSCLLLCLIGNSSNIYAKNKPQKLSDAEQQELIQRCEKLDQEYEAAKLVIQGFKDRIEIYKDQVKELENAIKLGQDDRVNLLAQITELNKQIESLNTELALERQRAKNLETERNEIADKLKDARSGNLKTVVVVGAVLLVLGFFGGAAISNK